MKLFGSGSIRKNLIFLVFMAVLPAFAILFYDSFEHRKQYIENAREGVTITVHGMAEQQRGLTRSTRQLLKTLIELPAIKQLNISETTDILRDLVANNPQISNLALVDLDGNVMTSGTGLANVNLADRKHFNEAIRTGDYAVGEFIVSRVGRQIPVFPSAIPLLDTEGKARAVLTLVYKLNNFSSYLDVKDVPEGSFIAVTDHNGVRMFYYPQQKDTNPVGKPIKGTSWEFARKTNGPGTFTNTGSDGASRIFAFEPVSLEPGDEPYIYFWSGTPEQNILASANEALLKSLALLSFALIAAILLAHLISNRVIINPLQNLVQLAGKLSKGDLEARCDTHSMVSEFNTLSNEFNHMAESLQHTNEKLSNLSLQDGLTGIANRRSFDKKLEEEWHRALRSNSPISLLLVDIDYFKNFNDTYGHLAGDDCLRTIGLILSNVANRAADLPARYGGEEFAVILPETDSQGALAIAEMIHEQMARREIPHKSSEVSQFLTVSIGLAMLAEPTTIKTPVELIKAADEQLYRAKREGRNQTCDIELKPAVGLREVN